MRHKSVADLQHHVSNTAWLAKRIFREAMATDIARIHVWKMHFAYIVKDEERVIHCKQRCRAFQHSCYPFNCDGCGVSGDISGIPFAVLFPWTGHHKHLLCQSQFCFGMMLE